MSDPATVNWLLFVMYQFSPFSSVPAMKKLRIDEYKHTLTIDSLACERLESSIEQLL